MKFITLTSYSSKKPVVINVETIGHIYEVEKKEYSLTESHTVVGTTCQHGGFQVTQDLQEILDLIKYSKIV